MTTDHDRNMMRQRTLAWLERKRVEAWSKSFDAGQRADWVDQDYWDEQVNVYQRKIDREGKANAV